MKLNDRERDLLAEVEGLLRGLLINYNSDYLIYRSAEPLAARLKMLRARLWPVDPPKRGRGHRAGDAP